MWKDPIVEEVREARRKLLAQFGGDLRKLIEWLKTKEAEHPERVVNQQQLQELVEARRKSKSK